MLLIIDLPVPLGVIEILPFVSVEVIALPSRSRLSTFKLSILLLESVRIAALAVSVPCA